MKLRWGVLSALTLFACTNVGLYGAGRDNLSAADRADFEGTACVPLAAGSAFPVKVLFALHGGANVPRETVGVLTNALDGLATRFAGGNVSFSLLAYHTVATGLQGGFGDGQAFVAALARYNGYQEAGPVSVRAPLKLAKTVLTGDMLSGCKATVGRTRYLVVVVALAADSVCQNLTSSGLSTSCTALPETQRECSVCELEKVTAELKVLETTHGAGEVVVQPIYVRETQDVQVSRQLAAIARSGGTQAIETDVSRVGTAISSLNYASLQRSLLLKRFFAVNRQSIVRAGQAFLDSDGDGLSDEEEATFGTNPALYDSDDDALGDGVEQKMGLSPTTYNSVPGCNPLLDEDGDRLSDCEERVLGTDACTGDTDGDGIPDLIEVTASTNPLVAEDLLDSDRDGVSDLDEVVAHTDPWSTDLVFAEEEGYRYDLTPADPTPDGRACYKIRAWNIRLHKALSRPHPPYADIPSGSNDVYLFFQAGRDNDPHASGVGALRVETFRLEPPAKKTPAKTVSVLPEEFVTGM